MSVLVVGAAGEVGEAVVARLIEQGDEVRVIEPDGAAAEHWRALGAHVAAGDPADADLVERAAQNARTIVALADTDIEPLVQGAIAARVERVVLCVHDHGPHVVAGSDLDFVALVVPRTRFARRAAVSPQALAEAVDAADDMAGNPRMFVNLGDAAGWRALGLEAP
jgi:Trk K+ transport system NAD-binding subunit